VKYVVRAVPILAILALVVAGLLSGTEQVRAAASSIAIAKEHPLFDALTASSEVAVADVSEFVSTGDANFGTLLRITVEASTASTLNIEVESTDSSQELFLALDETSTAGTFEGWVLIGDESATSTSVTTATSRFDATSVNNPAVIAVDDEDEVTFIAGTVVEAISVENESPEFDSFVPAAGSVVSSQNVGVGFEITDVDSGIPESEGLADIDGDGSYVSVFLITSDVQCSDSDLALATVALIVAVNCDGIGSDDIEITLLRSASDLDAIDDGWDVDRTIRLGTGTHYMGAIAVDAAGNFTVFDADGSDSDVMLASVTIDTSAPTLETNGVRTGVAWDAANKVYDPNERDWIQVVFDDDSDLNTDSIGSSSFTVAGHTVSRAVWYDVGPGDIAGGPANLTTALTGLTNALGAADYDGSTFHCSLAATPSTRIACDQANAVIVHPNDGGNAVNAFAFLRRSVFLQLTDDLNADEIPDVNVVPPGVSDAAGNNQDSAEDTAVDAIAPAFTITGPDRSLAGDSDDVEFTIVSDEALDTNIDVTVTLVTADPTDDNIGTGATLTRTIADTGSTRRTEWTVTVDGADDTGYYSIYVTGTDESSNGGTLGVLPADIASTDYEAAATVSAFYETDGDVDADAIFFQGDVQLPKPFVRVGGIDATTGDAEPEFRDPFFIEVDFTTVFDASSSSALENTSEAEEYITDSSETVTITTFELDDVGLLSSVTTTNNQVFLIAIDAISVGEHTVTIQAEDASGNELADVLALDFEVLERAAFALDVNPGWNLVSIPGDPVDASIETILGAAIPVTTVYSFDPEVPGGWLVAVRDTSADPWDGSLTTIDSQRGYWMFADQIETISIDIPRLVGGAVGAATPIQPPTIPLAVGWNLVPLIDVTGGADADTFLDADIYFAGANDEIARILSFNTITNAWNIIPFAATATDSDSGNLDSSVADALDDEDLQFGRAYWVYATSAATVVP
jgi:hypothetical protein